MSQVETPLAALAAIPPLDVSPSVTPNISPSVATRKPTRRTDLVTVGDGTSSPIPIEALVSVAAPIISAFVEADQEKQQRQIALEEKILEATSKQQRIWTIGLFVLSIFVLAIASVLVLTNREVAAIDLIKTVAALGGIGFGGYGLANSKNRGRSQDP
jgi:hypothetical protein